MAQVPFEIRSDSSILSSFGMTLGDAGRGFDTETQCRVYADALIRSRGRFAHLRTMYAAFVGGESVYMIENLESVGNSDALPAKLAFTDVEPGADVVENQLAVVWTERTLLEALTEERARQDFFTDLLDELVPILETTEQ